jgi:hypothetical protein
LIIGDPSSAVERYRGEAMMGCIAIPVDRHRRRGHRGGRLST